MCGSWKRRSCLLGTFLAVCCLVAVPLGTTGKAASSPSKTIDGVPLVRAPQRQLDECQKLANQLHRAVPCPGLVPDPIPTSPTTANCLIPGDCGPAEVQIYGEYLFMTQMNFQVPDGYVGVSIDTETGWIPEMSSNGGPLGHFVFETGTQPLGEYKPNSLKAASSIPSYCRRLSGQVAINGSTGIYYQCANSSNDHRAIETIAGHDMLQWIDHGMVTQVSFHGHTQVNLDLDLAVARSVVLVRPSR